MPPTLPPTPDQEALASVAAAGGMQPAATVSGPGGRTHQLLCLLGAVSSSDRSGMGKFTSWAAVALAGRGRRVHPLPGPPVVPGAARPPPRPCRPARLA